jgi:hypothetical protein
MYSTMPGNSPASAAPNKKRMTEKLTGSLTKAVSIESRPQVTQMRHIQSRAPTFCSIRLDGTSKKK